VSTTDFFPVIYSWAFVHQSSMFRVVDVLYAVSYTVAEDEWMFSSLLWISSCVSWSTPCSSFNTFTSFPPLLSISNPFLPLTVRVWGRTIAPQRVRPEPGRQMYFCAIHSPKSAMC